MAADGVAGGHVYACTNGDVAAVLAVVSAHGRPIEQWRYVVSKMTDPLTSLQDEVEELRAQLDAASLERDTARRFAATWKAAAKQWRYGYFEQKSIIEANIAKASAAEADLLKLKQHYQEESHAIYQHLTRVIPLDQTFWGNVEDVGCIVDRLLICRTQLEVEKKRREYYQNIVYFISTLLDQVAGRRIVCGTAENPSTELQEVVEDLVRRLKAAGLLKKEA